MVYEPPAAPSGTATSESPGSPCARLPLHGPYYHHWHFHNGKTTIKPGEFEGDGQKFISPILFVDGHAAKHDFTKALRREPEYPIEETHDWIWYQPRDTTNDMSKPTTH